MSDSGRTAREGRPTSEGGSATQSTDAVSSFSLITFANLLLKHGRAVVTVTAVVAIMSMAVGFLRREFVSGARLMPHLSESSASRLSGLAAQFGLNIAGSGGGESVEFYARLLRSSDLLREAVLTEYRIAGGDGAADTVRGDLISFLGVDRDTREAAVRAAVSELDARLSVNTDLNAGLIGFQLRAPSAELAVAVSRRLVALLNEFNLERRQSNAAAERAFVETRLKEAREALAAAETELQRFFDENRRYQESPRLMFEAARLERRVDFRQQLYTTLAQSYEQARIDEVRNTPVITVVESPANLTRSTLQLRRRAVVGLVLGLMLAGGYVAASEYLLWHRRANPVEHEELRTRLRAAKQYWGAVRGRAMPGQSRSEPTA